MTPREFAAIEARANAASAGPWESDGDYSRAEISQTAGDWATIVGTEEVGSGHLRENVLILSAADSQFIAHAREDIPALLAAVRERDNTIARVRELHVRNQDGSWTCGDWECEKCTLDDGHHGPVCDTCSFSTDDDIVPSVVFWPCPTVQIIDNLAAPGLRAALDPQETH